MPRTRQPLAAGFLQRLFYLLVAVIALVGVDARGQLDSAEAPFELWIIHADGSSLHKLVEMPGTTCGSPDWSPDGKHIAFDTWRVGKSFDDSKIVVILADGTQLHVIGPGGMPSWSPDGTQIVCHTYAQNPYGSTPIVVMNADGSGREAIIDHWGSPRWFPKRNRIASVNLDRELFVFDLSIGRERPIFPSRILSLPPESGQSPKPYAAQIGFGISPDGRQLCFGDVGGGLYLAALDEQGVNVNVRRLSKTMFARHCSWSPDGTRVVFGGKRIDRENADAGIAAADTPAGEQLFVVDVNSNNAPKPLPGQDPKKTNSCPDWSPDGNTIVFASQLPTLK